MPKAKNKTVLRFPTRPITADSLPLQIGHNVSTKRFNTYVRNREASGYKLAWKPNGDVFIVDTAGREHERIVSVLQRLFDVANGGAFLFNPPIIVDGQPFHPHPGGLGTKIAADVSVSPLRHLVQASAIPNPPGDCNRYPHARIVCEIALHQSVDGWEAKCQTWLMQPYVRYVFGIKIHDKRTTKNAVGQYNRSMTAKLWWRGAPAPGFIEWEFGMLQKGLQAATGCYAPGIPAFQVQIPTDAIFWDPPVVAGIPNLVGYVVAVSAGVAAANINIDLFVIQHWILDSQDNT